MVAFYAAKEGFSFFLLLFFVAARYKWRQQNGIKWWRITDVDMINVNQSSPTLYFQSKEYCVALLNLNNPAYPAQPACSLIILTLIDFQCFEFRLYFPSFCVFYISHGSVLRILKGSIMFLRISQNEDGAAQHITLDIKCQSKLLYSIVRNKRRPYVY